jgi:cyclohexadienyl dehydratase
MMADGRRLMHYSLLLSTYAVIAQMKADGTLRQLHEKYGLVYGYE